MTTKKVITKVQELIYELKIEKVMLRNVITVSPENRMCELRDLLHEHRISGVPVMDKNHLVGIVSIEDFIKSMAEGELDSFIKDKMTRKVKCLYSDEALTCAVRKFRKYNYGRFPVLDRETGELAGMITKGNIVEGLLKQLEIEYHEEEIHRHQVNHVFDDIVADNKSLKLQYEIKGHDFKHAGTASSELKKSLNKLGIDKDTIRRVAIASYEAEMNIVIYTDGGRISAEVKPDQITAEAIDTGPGIPDIERAMQPGYSTAPDWIQDLGFGAGMGLNNIQRCVDCMDIQSELGHGTHLTISVNLQHTKDETK